MGRRFQVVIDCADPARLGDFWAQVLGYVQEPPPDGFDSWPDALRAWGVPEDQMSSANALVDPDGVGPRVFFPLVPEGKSLKNRLHLDVRVSDPDTDAGTRDAAVLVEVDRLEALGATPQTWTEDFGKHFMVMTDPEGNEFCVT